MLSTLLFNLYVNDQPDFWNEESNTREDHLHIPKLDVININNVLITDDLTKLSLSKYDL